ncbi:hypothetical protein ON010_g2013 [Phytophthora cinnamomi]|nr:hypothetical protein ON010_g2013 [Phytophthora cinnamomi]
MFRCIAGAREAGGRRSRSTARSIDESPLGGDRGALEDLRHVLQVAQQLEHRRHEVHLGLEPHDAAATVVPVEADGSARDQPLVQELCGQRRAVTVFFTAAARGQMRVDAPQRVLVNGETDPRSGHHGAAAALLQPFELHLHVAVVQRQQLPVLEDGVRAAHGAVGDVRGHGGSQEV